MAKEAGVRQVFIDDVALIVLACHCLQIQRPPRELAQVVQCQLEIGRAQVGQYALANDQIEGFAGLVIHYRAALPAKAATQVLAELHSLVAAAGELLLHHILPQANATAHIQYARNGNPQILQIAAHKSAQTLNVLGVHHAGLFVKVKALVVRLVEPLVAC